MKRKMTSKRALQKLSYVPIFEDDDSNMITDTCCCVYVGDLCEVYDREVNVIKKDLELLDIIKFLIKKGDIVVNPDLFVDYPELYEWLEQNEWNTTKSNKFNQCYKVIN